MTEPDATVFVVEDDPPMREALKNLLRSVRLRVEAFESGQEFLSRKRLDVPGCLLLDVRLPGLSGLDLQKWMIEAGVEIPIVFITGHGDIPMSVRAIKAGAVEFLTKPFREQNLLDAIQQALERDRKMREQGAELQKLRSRFELLTMREREVMKLMVAGLLNKQIAGKLGTSEATVKVHRHKVIDKMCAGSLAELVRMAERLRIFTPK
jgi:FixJ family two-component response regulator